MAFNAPTREDMRTAVARSLRDAGGQVFASEVINGFIDEALSDLGTYRPKEFREVSVWPLPTQPLDANIILNGSFEDATLEGWDSVGIESTSVFSATAPVGDRTLRLKGGASAIISQIVPVIPGVTYRLEAWALRAAGDRPGGINLDTFKDDALVINNVFGMTWAPAGSTPTGWVYKEGWWAVPDDDSVDSVRLNIYVPNPSDTTDDWRFDAVELRGEQGLPDPLFSTFSDVWMVQYRVGTGDRDMRVTTIPPTGHGSNQQRAGWSFYQKRVVVSDNWARQMQSAVDSGHPVEMVVWGYADRDLPLSDDDVLDLADNTDYLCVLNHCKHLGFELLAHDRSLYQQWLAATNNTDVSPTQLLGMVSSAEQTYDRMRRRNTVLRRPPAGDVAFTY